MQGKIKLKLNQKSSIRNKKYEVFIDENFIGNIDYKSPKLDYIANIGTHKILIKGNDFEKEENFTLSSQKIIQPIELNENIFWSKSSTELQKFVNGILIGILIVYLFVIAIMLYDKMEINLSTILPFFLILTSISLTKNSQKFTLNFK
ncbi:hypothetical protein [Daejeonia sp. YH14]|uniref:hypothetical protein n=1 Tax=Daejeonia sp. YH14 TaxID=3439042 RepID=UPI003F4947D8